MSDAVPPLISMDLKKRSDLHLARKIWHIVSVSGMALVFSYTSYRFSIGILILAWLIFVPIDLARQRYHTLNDIMIHLFRPIMRDSEQNKLAGTSYLLTGVGLVVAIFPRDIVLLTLLFLAYADPVASYFGIKYGRDKILGQKSLQGTLAAFVVCTVLSFGFLYTHALLQDRWLVVSLLCGFIGALAELIPIAKLDDNFTLPILSSTFLYLLFTLFGGLT